MKRALLWLQVAILALGTVFSWATLAFDYRRFFSAGGRALELSGCLVANPVVTPCFYGALAFLAALVSAVAVLCSARERVANRQRGLQWLLAAGTVFAWGNFAYEVYRYLQAEPAAAFACPPSGAAANPLTLPCFYGALIYTAALAVSALILHASRTAAT
jgi:hypothetical protein